MATATTTTEALTAGYLAQLAERTPGSHELRRAAEQVLAGGVSSHFKAWQPFYVSEAKGAHLTDVDGNEYVDLIMGFGPNPLRLGRMRRPQDDDRAGAVQPFLDDLGVTAVGRELVIAPDLVAFRAERLGDTLGVLLVRPSIGNEDFRHTAPVNG